MWVTSSVILSNFDRKTWKNQVVFDRGNNHICTAYIAYETLHDIIQKTPFDIVIDHSEVEQSIQRCFGFVLIYYIGTTPENYIPIPEQRERNIFSQQTWNITCVFAIKFVILAE